MNILTIIYYEIAILLFLLILTIIVYIIVGVRTKKHETYTIKSPDGTFYDD